MAATIPQLNEDSVQPTSLIGRDEMNLAEFPIALLADRVPNGQKTLYFEDKHGRLTVTGSDEYGLPTAADTDVIVALIYLTKLRNGFKDVKVNFSRYELINVLNWRHEGGSYKRLDQSFNRWSGVLLVYDKCWWDNKLKRYVSAKMHILESVILVGPGGKYRDGQSLLPLSTFTWNKTFIESCQADNLRQLNLDTYFSLKSSISKRLYRFLGKRFYLQRDWTFDLNEIAFDRVGLSRDYERNAGKIKEKLQPAIAELEAVGLLRPLSRDDRYSRIDRGQWTIRLTRQSPGLAAMPEQPPRVEQAPSPWVAVLIERGVTASSAAELARRHPAERIEEKIDVFDWLAGKQDKRIEKSPAGYLVKSIVSDYATPKGFVSRAERQAREEAKQAKARKATEDRRRERQRKAAAQAERQAVDAYIEQLGPAERRSLETDALARAGPEAIQNYEDPVMARYRDTLMLGMLREHVRQLLIDGGKIAR